MIINQIRCNTPLLLIVVSSTALKASCAVTARAGIAHPSYVAAS